LLSAPINHSLHLSTISFRLAILIMPLYSLCSKYHGCLLLPLRVPWRNYLLHISEISYSLASWKD
jgi:hypothetical protein